MTDQFKTGKIPVTYLKQILMKTGEALTVKEGKLTCWKTKYLNKVIILFFQWTKCSKRQKLAETKGQWTTKSSFHLYQLLFQIINIVLIF